MPKDIIDLADEIRKLPRAEGLQLIRMLLEVLDGPSDPDADRAWLEEGQRRSAELDAGLVEAIPGEEVFERIRSRFKK